MSRRRIFIAGTGVLLCLTFLVAATPRETDWKAVDDAISRGLPKTAIERLEPIIAQAKREKAYAEAVKAITLMIALEGNIQGNQAEEKITRMRGEIDQAPAEMKPVMEAVLANWYWHYFQRNRWRFMQRTQTTTPPGDDFTTWDLTRILAEVDRQFQRALADTELLKKVPIAQFDALFEKGNAPDSYRPTLFDVLAHNALEFYASGEQAASRAQDAFDLTADSAIFGKVSDFLAWQPAKTDDESATLKAIRLYQDLLRFHQPDAEESAFIDADLLRLKFGNNHAFGEEKVARYRAALRRLADAHADHPISSRALHHLATTLHEEGDWVKAHTVASEGHSRFPDSVGGRRCANLVATIEARESRVQTERVWNDPRTTIDVTYRNVSRVFFRLVQLDFESYVRSNRYRPEQLNANQRRTLLARRPLQRWSSDLRRTNDYQSRVEQIPIPEDVPPGSYYLLASHNAEFNDVDNQVSVAEVWVSDLALVTRNHQGRGLIDGFLLQADDGTPISGGTVRVWRRGSQNAYIPLPSVSTDRNGMFQIRGSDHQQLLLLATHRDQSLSSTNQLRPYVNPKPKPTEQTRFFTDRALYRPGQTIHYKGICIAVNSEQDDYQTISGRRVNVVFTDVNGKEIERVEHRTNDYGSFSGSVTAPRDRLMGRMSLRVPEGPRGSVQVTVEEYKRPKFEVQLDAPQVAAKLGSEVKLRGRATAYTGAAINDAKVHWRVVRKVQHPAWWFWRCWWLPPRGGSSQEIAHGTSATASNGTFEIGFTATPDLTVAPESEPTFRYIVTTDVTDPTGETRSAERTVNVGYTALSASLSADDWLTDDQPVDLRIQTLTLDGEGQKASGVVQVFAVKQPEAVARASLIRRPYRYKPGESPQPDPSNPNSWAVGEMVLESAFETNAGGAATLSRAIGGRHVPREAANQGSLWQIGHGGVAATGTRPRCRSTELESA